jgi:nucleotide-binding universal stress UspA family protein
MPSEPVRPVLAGVDDSPMGAAVASLAVREAAVRGVPAVLLHTAGVAGPGPLNAALAQARAARPESTVIGALVDDDPADALTNRSAGAAMVVVGHGSRRARRPCQGSRGSVALRLLGRAGAPVIVYRPRRTPSAAPLPVLVGVDGLPGAEAAVEFGFVEAALHAVPLRVVHLWPPAGASRGGCDRVEAEGAFLDLLDTWSGKYPKVPVEMSVRHGLDAVIVLAAASRSAGLVVVSTPVPAGSDPISRGSPLAALLDRAGCPIVVVPAETLHPGTFGPAAALDLAVR